MSYILPPLISLIFSIVLAIITLKIKKANQSQEDEAKKIAKLLDKEERENQRNLIREEIKPIVDEIAEIHVSLGVING
jgi:flagellar biosynthesis component FlhA